MSERLNQVSDTTADRMRADMRNTLEQNIGYDETREGLLEALVDDGMFPVEFLLVQNHDLEGKLAQAEDEIQVLVEELASAQHQVARINSGLGWPR